MPSDMLPSEAMYIVKFNDFIENIVSGYQTLTVSGRGMLGYSLHTNDISGGDGQMFIGANLPARDLTIEYVIDSKTPEQFIKKLDQLTNLLLGKQFWFYFNDDTMWYYQGTVSSFEAPEKGQLLAKGSFTITCSDPFKYSDNEVSNGNQPISGQAKIDEIDFKPNAAVGKFSITNDYGQSMIIDGTVNGGDTIIIKPHVPSIMLNGTYHTEWFGFASDIENFAMTNNIRASVDGSFIIKYRRFRL